jgi:hypothetical protein
MEMDPVSNRVVKGRAVDERSDTRHGQADEKEKGKRAGTNTI